MSIANHPAADRRVATNVAANRYSGHWTNLTGLLVGCLAVAVPLCYWGLFDHIVSDHAAHVRFVQRGVAEGVWPAHFLFQAIVYAFSGLSQEFIPLAWTSLALLVVCVVAKAWLSYGALVHYCPTPASTLGKQAAMPHATLLAVVTAGLMLSAPIVRPWWTSRIYLGQISPSIWHNPTSIVCWPLVILLFFAAAAFLRSGRPRDLVAIGALAAISVLAKPSYFLAFAPVCALLAWRRFGFSRVGWLSQLALLPTVGILCWQLTTSFGGPNAMRPDIHIAWKPLAAWHLYSNWISVSLLFSLAFPLSYLLVMGRDVRHRDLLVFAWGVMLSAIAWMACFAEVHDLDGTVNGDFNFSWGAHLSLYVLFLVTAIDLLSNPAIAERAAAGRLGHFWARLPWWLLATHAASGLLWIARQALGKGFV